MLRSAAGKDNGGCHGTAPVAQTGIGRLGRSNIRPACLGSQGLGIRRGYTVNQNMERARMKTFSLCLLALILVAGPLAREADAQGAPDSLGRLFHVTHYDARVEPNISDKTIKGIVVVDLIVIAESQTTIELDSGDLTIDAVNEGGAPVDFDTRDHRLTIRWPRPARINEARQLEVAYHGAPRFGMQFFSERPQVYTVFSTSQWLVCVDAPDDRSTLNLSVVLPAGLTMVASGTLVAQHALPNGTVVHEWRQGRPMPSYTFGFAAGRFMDVAENRKGHRLRYLGSDFSTAQLRRIFADSADMMRFFEDRAGVRYHDPIYTQALVANTIGQEMSGFSVMSEDYGRAVLADPRAESLMAHELAHQWWGNSVLRLESPDGRGPHTRVPKGGLSVFRRKPKVVVTERTEARWPSGRHE
jgi:aminopeptidase N